MKIKTQLTLAAVIAAGMLASGCSQMSAQQVAADPVPVPETKTVLDCSSCNKPAPAPRPAGNSHSHPAIPGCTNSVTHNHKFNNPNHKHSYSCKKPAPRPVAPPAPQPVYVQPMQPQPPVVIPPAPVMPKVKAKGTYRGPITIDQGVMQQYQQ